MFGLLVFFFKLFFSTFFAVLFSYFIAEEEDSNISVILFAILGVSLSLIAGDSFIEKNAISILVFSILYLSYNYFSNVSENKKILFLFPGLIGLLVGFGLILESILILLFLYIAQNSLTYIYESNVDGEDDSQKIEKKINNIK